MPPLEPVVLIVTTQTWLQVTRLALRLSHYGCRVSALGPNRSELRFFDHLHSWHRFQPADPMRSLDLAIEGSGARYLVPGDDRAVWLLHELAQRYPHYRELIERSLGPMHSFATVRSRPGLLALAASLGVLTPDTAVVGTLEEVEAWSRGRALPLVLKLDGTWAGGGVQVVNERATLREQWARLRVKPTRWQQARRVLLPAAHAAPSGHTDAEISVQAYIEGVAANAMFACDRGRVLGSVQARVVAAKWKTGPAMLIELIDDPQIDRAGALLAASLELSGFFGLDFILERETGAPYLIEMNPRCTQMGHIAVSGHADLAGLLWAQWSGQSAPPAGQPGLSTSIGFYPQAAQWAPGSRFLEKARPDVCHHDRTMVDRLAAGDPALTARSRRVARAQLVKLKRSVLPPETRELFYFDPEMTPRATQALGEDQSALVQTADGHPVGA